MSYSPLRFSQYARDLARAIDAMRIRITEPTFFLGQDRKEGDILDQVEVGPFRTKVIPGGLARIPQFVEMPEEIKRTIAVAAADVGKVEDILPPMPAQQANALTPAPGSFGEATAAVLKPAAAAAPISRTAALLSGLAARRRKLEETIANEADAYAKHLDEVEGHVPAVFSKAKTSLDDRQASLGEIDASLKEFAGANRDPLQG